MIAAGDSYNDLTMIHNADKGFLFRTTEKIKEDNPDVTAFDTYDEFLAGIKEVIEG